MRSVDLLLKKVRAQTKNEEYGVNNGIATDQYVRFFREGQKRIINLLQQARPHTLTKYAYIDVVARQEEYDIPTDAYLSSNITKVEFSVSGRPENFVPLQMRTPGQRVSIVGVPSLYIPLNKKIILNPIPQNNIGQGIRITYQYTIPDIGIRAGRVSQIGLDPFYKDLTSVTLDSTSIPDAGYESTYNNEDTICIVDKDGNFVIRDIPVTTYNSSTKTFSIPNYICATNPLLTDVATVAGSGSSGNKNGVGITAQFVDPYGITIDTSGNLYVADFTNQRIVKIAPNGVTSTLLSGFTVIGLDMGPDGFLYFVSYTTHRIYKVNVSTGAASIYAGSGVSGFADNVNPLLAQFANPYDCKFDAAGNLYVCDYSNNRIRKIAANGGAVTTVVGNGTATSVDGIGTAATTVNCSSLGIDKVNNVIYFSDNSSKLRRFAASTLEVMTIATGLTTGGIGGIAIDSVGSVYIADTSHKVIKKFGSNGVGTTVAGSGAAGTADGPLLLATFNAPAYLVFDSNGILYVTDYTGRKVRSVNFTNTYVVLDKYTTNISLLDDICERYLMAYCAWKIFKFDSNVDSTEQDQELALMEKEIIDSYNILEADYTSIPIISDDWLGDNY